MSKILVAYFSASGVTADAAEKIAEITGGELYEIRPEAPYTQADLNWRDPLSRSSAEMKDRSSRPRLAAGEAPSGDCDTILLGFPIWWYTAPRIVNTFLESLDVTGKRIVLFATSGSSGFEKTLSDLRDSAAGASLEEGVVVHGREDADAWRKWLGTLGL